MQARLVNLVDTAGNFTSTDAEGALIEYAAASRGKIVADYTIDTLESELAKVKATAEEAKATSEAASAAVAKAAAGAEMK